MKPFGKHLVALLLILTLLAQAFMAGATTAAVKPLTAGKAAVTPLPPLPDQYIAQADGTYVLRSSYMLELAILRESAAAKDLADATFLMNLRIQARDEAIFRALTQVAAARLKATFSTAERTEAEGQLYAMIAADLGVQDATDVASIRTAWTKQHPTIPLDAAIQRAIQDQEFVRLKRIQSADIWACCKTIYTECLLAITRDKETSLQPFLLKAAEYKKLLLDLERQKNVLRPADYDTRKASLATKTQKLEADMQKIRLQGGTMMKERVLDIVQKKYPAFPVAPFLTRMLAYPSAETRSCFEVIPLPCDGLTEDEAAYVADLAAALLVKAQAGTSFNDLLVGAYNDETAWIDQDPDQAALHATIRDLLARGQEPIVLTQTQKKKLLPDEPEAWVVEEARLIESEQGWNLLRFKGDINAGNCVPWNLACIIPSYAVPFLDMAFRSVNQWERTTVPVIRYNTRLDG